MAKALNKLVDPIIGDLISSTLELGSRGTAVNESDSEMIPVHRVSRNKFVYRKRREQTSSLFPSFWSLELARSFVPDVRPVGIGLGDPGPFAQLVMLFVISAIAWRSGNSASSAATASSMSCRVPLSRDRRLLAEPCQIASFSVFSKISTTKVPSVNLRTDTLGPNPRPNPPNRLNRLNRLNP